MTRDEFREELHRAAYVAEVNQHYHQQKQYQMWWWDKAFKSGVAVLASVALLAVFLPHECKGLEISVAFLALVAAIILNVVPVGEWMMEYGEMFRSWSEQLLGAEHMKMKERELSEEQPIPDHLTERLTELVCRSCQLDATESAADDDLLSRCQEDINQRMYGKNIRTYEQAMAEHAKAENANNAS